MQEAVEIVELSRPEFLARIGDFLAIYAAAMAATPDELPARQSIMERHAGHPGFRALAVLAGPAAADGAAGDGPAGPRAVVAFTYGFHGVPGQWWHDVVRAGLAAAAGPPAAAGWLGEVMEIAEVHVHPGYQARGIGRRMVLALTTGRPEWTAVLSTRDAPTRARRLYRSLGFTDLLTDFMFPGGGPPYAVMGAQLPLASP